jgi:hypothetical protein
MTVSVPLYHTLEQRALAGLVAGCAPRPRRPAGSPQRRIAVTWFRKTWVKSTQGELRTGNW